MSEHYWNEQRIKEALEKSDKIWLIQIEKYQDVIKHLVQERDALRKVAIAADEFLKCHDNPNQNHRAHVASFYVLKSNLKITLDDLADALGVK